jgi:hypothetical protein
MVTTYNTGGRYEDSILCGIGLRSGINYETDRYWTQKHYRWLEELKFEMALDEKTVGQYLSHIEGLEGRLERIGKINNMNSHLKSSDDADFQPLPSASCFNLMF